MKIRTISKVYGLVIFEMVHNMARQMDSTGVSYAPTRTYDSSFKWILDQLEHMRNESPDLTFDPL